MAEKTPPPTVEDTTPPATDVRPARGLSDEEWAAWRARRGLLTDWRVALSDAITAGLAAYPDDPDAAARLAADQAMDSIADALDDAAEALDGEALDRIEQRVKAEKKRRPVTPNVRGSSGGAS